MCGAITDMARCRLTTPARPSNSRIARLSEENALLKASLEKTQAIGSTESARFVSAHGPMTSHLATGANIHADTSRQNMPRTAEAFHGPSSALHDASISTSTSALDSSTVEYAASKSELFAEASRQRKYTIAQSG